MKAKVAHKRSRPSLIEQTRRAQIVAAAIDVIADVGYARATFAQIAKRAGLSSTGLISYHFADKDELDGAIAASVIDRLSQHMTAAMVDVPDPQAALVAYITGLIGFMQHNPPAMQALFGIVLHGGVSYDGASEREATSGLRDILRWGQTTGQFRAFDLTVMATTIQRSLDGIPLAQATNPTLDLDAYARELITIFTLATRKEV